MPTMEMETIGGISTGFTSYSGQFFVPPYSQNPSAAAPYMLVHAIYASDIEIADNEKVWRQYNYPSTAYVPC